MSSTSKPPTPSYLRAPRLADQLVAALRTYLAQVDRTSEVGAAHAETIADFLAETEPFGTGVTAASRTRPLGAVDQRVDPARTGTEG